MSSVSLPPKAVTVSNNLIHDCGVFGKQTAGVYISRAKRITAAHNTIFNMPRAGICIGDGTWGGHVIEYNHIHDTVRETGDHGLVTGGLRVSSDFAKALALGADAVAIGTAALMAIGCQQYRICDTGRCPIGIATQDPGLRARLDVEESARWLANFLRVSTEEIKDFARLTGNDSVHKLSVRDLVTTNSEISVHTSIEHA